MIRNPDILVIEYEHEIRVAYRKTLETQGYRVISTANGKSGLEILQKEAETIQLIILSLRMPIMDGNEFLRLKLQDPKIESVPTVVIANYLNDLRYPVAEILQKPITNGTLVKVVRKYFQRGHHQEPQES